MPCRLEKIKIDTPILNTKLKMITKGYFLCLAMVMFALASTLALLTGCSRSVAQQQPPPPQVTVAPVEQKSIVEWSEFTGHTEPVDSVEIRPRVSGYIQEVRFQSGQLVKKGDVLFVIDPRWNQAVFDQRQAEYDQAKSEADRIDLLLKNNAISTEEADQRKARFEEAKAALESARLDLEYTEVRAPIDGRVSRALLTEGNYVSGTAGSASLLTTVVSVDPVYVYVDIDEASLLQFNELVSAKKLDTTPDGKVPVELQLADESDFPHKGCVESFDNQLNADTGSILMRAVFANGDGRIVPGLFARIRLPLSERHSALLVDERAIGTDQANKFVLTLSPTNTVKYQPVELGPLVDGKRIVRTGLVPGEKVVVNGLERVRPGMPVSPEDASGATPVVTASR
jgi:RND family efflux transporter MFP subunit